MHCSGYIAVDALRLHPASCILQPRSRFRFPKAKVALPQRVGRYRGLHRAQGGPRAQGGAQKWPGRLRLGRQATVPNLLGMTRSIPAVPDAIGGLYDEIWGFLDFQNSISWT